ncbi:MAG: hypothetical protein JKY27_08730 [Magnetovibrio sp.]|nr:hypothetical protein [Magnetovibrio sp.]
MPKFDPSKLSVLASVGNPALGRATGIMLSALGFANIKISPAENICMNAEQLKPTFILFTPEYLTMPVAERIKCGCPCKKKDKCNKSLIVIFLRKKSVDSVLMSKEMGFDGIVFADQSIDRLYEALQTVYETNMIQEI